MGDLEVRVICSGGFLALLFSLLVVLSLEGEEVASR